MNRAFIAVLLAATLSVPLAAQTPPTTEPGSQLTVYLLTMGPGDQVWEKFGHNAIWIHDEQNHTDIAYHWGLFDFADKDFVPRFVQGRMRYSMGAFDMNQTIDAYRRTNRTVWAQQLNLTPPQRQHLQEFVSWNVLPENRYYRYDYFRDNCSTRVRDAIDGALGGIVKRSTENIPSGTTYRFHTSRLTQDDWPIFTGTMMGLGEPTDREISGYEEMFLPVRMMDRFRAIRVAGASGSQPLVLNERVLFQATRPAEDTQVRRGTGGFFSISLVVLAFWAVLWVAGRNSERKTGLLVLAMLWSLIAGLAGVLLTGLWGFTDHLYSYRNENVLQLNPLSLVVVFFLVRLIWKRRKSGGAGDARAAIRGAAIVAALSIIGFVMQILPGLDQVNGDVIALALPLHLGVVVVLLALSSQTSATPLES